MLYVAVVYNTENGVKSNRPEGDYSCFVGTTKAEAINKAIKAKAKWDGYKSNTTGKVSTYTIIVGKMTAKAIPSYTEVNL